MSSRELSVEYLKSRGFLEEEIKFTCDECGCTEKTCNSKYDPYCIDGDCLAEK